MNHPAADDDLDFTAPAKPAPPPPPEKMASARKEATTGSPQLAKTGFYVAMARNAGGRVTPRNGSRHPTFLIGDHNALSGLLGAVLPRSCVLPPFPRDPPAHHHELDKSPPPRLLALPLTCPRAHGHQ